MKRIGIIGLVVLLMLSLLPLTTAAATEYGTVTGGWLRLRSAPSFSATVYKSYYTGTVVEILGTSGSWYHVKTPDNRAGYMYSSYIKEGGGGGGGGTGYTAYVTSTNGYGVRMRTGPSKGYRVIAVYPVTTAVSVLQTGILWSRIQVGSNVGYMMSEFLTTTPPGPTPTTPPSGDMATVRSDNGYGVRLRSGPGTNYSIIGLCSIGTRVSVVTRGADWDYIRVGSRLGYMMNYFLAYDKPSDPVATGITIAAASASGGQGETVGLTVNVSGTSLSSPAYTLEITKNAEMAKIQDGKLQILGTATIGAEIKVTATTTDKNAEGNLLSATCTVIVIEGTVSNFSFDRSEASIMVAGVDAQLQMNYTLDGPPYITLSVPASVSSYVSTSVDSTNKKVTITVDSTIPSGTEFILTGKTNTDGPSGSPLTDTVKITIVSNATLGSIKLVPEHTSLNQGATADINATLTYTNGTVVQNVSLSNYTLEITSGGDYAAITGKTLTAGIFSSLNDQTVTVKGTSTADATKTDTCDIVIAAGAIPNAPSLISVIPGDRQVRLTWAAPVGGATVSGYEAFYSESYDGAKTQIGGTLASDAREVTASPLDNGTTYYFWVRAKNTTGAGEYSNYLTASPTVVAPDVPTGLALAADPYSTGSVKITWVAPAYNGGAAITNYLVYVDGTLVDSATVSTDLYRTIQGLENGHTYSIAVKAKNTVGESAASTPLSVTIPNVPDAPVITSCDAGFKEFTVGWSTPAPNGSTISGYTIRYWTTDPGDKTIVASTANPETIIDLTAGATYNVEVIANSNMGDSSASEPQSCTPYEKPGVPTNVAVAANTPSTGHATVTWGAPATTGGKAITGYRIRYALVTEPAIDPILYLASDVFTRDIDLVPTLGSAGSYWFEVSATNDGGTNYSDPVTVTVTIDDPTPAPAPVAEPAPAPAVPESGEEPAGEEEPVGEEPPAGEEEPAGEEPPAGEEEPAGEEPPAGEEEPAGEEPPAGEEEPAGEEPPAGEEEPTGEEIPAV